MPILHLQEAQDLAKRLQGEDFSMVNDPELTRIVCTKEEKAIIIRALHLFIEVQRGDFARVSR